MKHNLYPAQIFPNASRHNILSFILVLLFSKIVPKGGRLKQRKWCLILPAYRSVYPDNVYYDSEKNDCNTFLYCDAEGYPLTLLLTLGILFSSLLARVRMEFQWILILMNSADFPELHSLLRLSGNLPPKDFSV